MKMTRISAILVLVLGLMVWPGNPVNAAPMGTAFRYQGQLMDAGGPANGIYDLAFVLYPVPDGPAEGELAIVMSEDVNIVDGFFTMDLEFGSGVFDGNDRWLQIEVRSGELHDPNVYTILTPRQRIVPTPYAIYAERAGSAPGGGTDGGPGGIGGGGTTNYIPKFTASSSIGDSVIYQSGDNLGIGTTSPDARLHVNGLIKISDGSPGTGKVLTSDDTGLASWQTPTGASGPDDDWTISGNDIYHELGKVGIGTSGPTSILHVTGSSSQPAILGYNAGTGAGLRGESTAGGYGVYGEGGGQFGILGDSVGYGVRGKGDPIGVLGSTLAKDGVGVVGLSGAAGIGVYGDNPLGCAGFFDGDVEITGKLSKSSGSFKIDHPLDPENKFLEHSFVESPDMMNVYNGNVTLDENGEAVVQLPEYFEALNRDFRYQLTCIGGFAPVYIAEKISDNSFKIGGGKPGMEVSWQVTGIRQDPYAVANRIQVEEDKPAEERGYYLHAKAYGLPEAKGIETVRNPRPSRCQEVAKKELNYESDKHYN